MKDKNKDGLFYVELLSEWNKAGKEAEIPALILTLLILILCIIITLLTI